MPADTAAPNRFSAMKAEKFFSNLNKNSRAVEGTPKMRLIPGPSMSMKGPSRSSVIMNATPVNATYDSYSDDGNTGN